MAGEFLLVTQFLTATVMLGLAGWLLWLRFDLPLNRAFAFFLFVRAGLTISQRFQFDIVQDPRWVSVWESMSGYFGLVLPMALLYFMVVYLQPRHHKAIRWGIIGATVVVLVLFMVDHCLLECTAESGMTAFGPLSLLLTGTTIVGGIVGWILAHHVGKDLRGLGRAATGLVAGAILLDALLDSAIAWAFLATFGWEGTVLVNEPNGWQWVPSIWFGLGIIPAFIGIIVLSRRLSRDESTRHQVEVLWVLGLLAILTALFVGLVPDTISPGWRQFAYGLWRITIPTLIAIALLRHRLFGIDVKLKTAVKSSTIAAVFAAAFFVGSELLEQVIPVNGILLGLLTSAVITLGLRPIQIMGQRVAETVFPGVKPFGDMTKRERLEAYAEQARLMWADRVLTEKERMLLDRLKERLRISAAEAAEVETVFEHPRTSA